MRVERPSNPWDVRVDRSSVLGNKYRMGLGGRNRENVCDAYDTWLKKAIRDSYKSVTAELHRLDMLHQEHGILRLFCWCTPKRCHAESIKQYLQVSPETKIDNK